MQIHLKVSWRIAVTEKHRLKSGEQTIDITVSKEPDLAGIDPNRLLIDKDIYDNFIQIIGNIQ